MGKLRAERLINELRDTQLVEERFELRDPTSVVSC